MGNSVNTKQYIYLSVLYSLGNTFIILSSSQFQRDFWTSFIIGAILSIPFIFIYSKILDFYPGQNLFNILITIYGKVWGKIISAFFLFYVINLAALALRGAGDFIVILNLNLTPVVAVMALITIICIMIARCGIYTLGKTTLYIFPLILVIVIGTALLSIKYINPNNIFPVIIEEKSDFARKCFTGGAIPFGELVVMTTVMTKKQDQNSKKKKSNFVPMISSAGIILGIILVIFFRNYLTLGPQSHGLYYFPSYDAVGIIPIGNFLFTIELFISIYLLSTALIRIGVLITSCAEGLSTVFNCGNQREMATSAGALVFSIASILFNNTEELAKWVKFYPFFSLPFQIILPIIVLIGAIIKSKQRNNGLPIANVKTQTSQES